MQRCEKKTSHGVLKHPLAQAHPPHMMAFASALLALPWACVALRYLLHVLYTARACVYNEQQEGCYYSYLLLHGMYLYVLARA